MMLGILFLAAEAQARDTFVLDRAEYGADSGQHVFTGLPLEIEKEWVGQVDLFGIGDLLLDRRYLSEQLGDLAPAEGGVNFLVRLGFRQLKNGGRTISCEVLETSGGAPDDADERVCSALRTMEWGGVRTRRGFEWGAETGYLTFDLALYRAPDILRPFAQALGRKGVPVKVSVPSYPTPKDGLPNCFVQDQRISWDEHEAVCEIYERQYARSNARASDGKPLEKWQTGQIYLMRTADRSRYSIMVDVKEIGPSGYNRPVYAPVELDADLKLTDQHGNLRFLQHPTDYPERAKRTDVTGRTTVLLRFEPERRSPSGCRIIVGSGSSVLDNASCMTAFRRARWDWKHEIKPFAGAWHQVTIAWSLNGRIGRDRLPDSESDEPSTD